MDDRNRTLWEALISETSPSKITIISGILYGNLMTRIGEGPMGIYNTFLDPQMDKINYQEESLLKLKLYMNQFIVFTQKAIEMFRDGMTTNMAPWFKESLIEYKKLRNVLYDRSVDSHLIDILAPFDVNDDKDDDLPDLSILRKPALDDLISLPSVPSNLSSSYVDFENNLLNNLNNENLNNNNSPVSVNSNINSSFSEPLFHKELFEEPPITSTFEYKQYYKPLRPNDDFLHFFQNPFEYCGDILDSSSNFLHIELVDLDPETVYKEKEETITNNN